MWPIIFFPLTYILSIWRKPLFIISLNQAAIAIILGMIPLLLLAELPQQREIYFLIGLAFCLWFVPCKSTRITSLVLWTFIFGCWHGHLILNQITYFSETSRSATVMIESVSLGAEKNNAEEKERYRIRFIESDGKYIFPALFASVLWNSSESLCAGQIWQVTMKLRPVHAQLNHGSYDSQRYALSIRQPLNGKITKSM
ncbi:DUF4131 domain-containing protein [Xenorhabdus bovienii]|uniref:DUF4131 domain-containing protein n=1 Tax=Xenorhabdus bovienii TaxID=40576 RepID=UPI00237CB39A|nr:DUF4131 domain-containing protein [Xenorhabdus bovienii]MDE1493274.1 hypothetical protein [Xenorhabdus bovienii]